MSSNGEKIIKNGMRSNYPVQVKYFSSSTSQVSSESTRLEQQRSPVLSWLKVNFFCWFCFCAIPCASLLCQHCPLCFCKLLLYFCCNVTVLWIACAGLQISFCEIFIDPLTHSVFLLNKFYLQFYLIYVNEYFVHYYLIK